MAEGNRAGVATLRLVSGHSVSQIGEVHVGESGTFLRTHTKTLSGQNRARALPQMLLRKIALGTGQLSNGGFHRRIFRWHWGAVKNLEDVSSLIKPRRRLLSRQPTGSAFANRSSRREEALTFSVRNSLSLLTSAATKLMGFQSLYACPRHSANFARTLVALGCSMPSKILSAASARGTASARFPSESCARAEFHKSLPSPRRSPISRSI